MKSFAGIALTVVLIVGGLLFSYLYREYGRTLMGGDGASIALKAENEKLLIELEKLRGGVCIDGGTGAGLRADVYAEYPWNNQELLVINKGKLHGLATGMPVLTEEGFVVGNVVRVHTSTAEVQTVFDPSWKSSVMVGTAGIKAVFVGGVEPHLSLIPEQTTLTGGESVVNTSPGLPLYAPLGTVGAVEKEREGVWKEARVSIPYRQEDLASVFVRIDFP